MLRFSLFGIPIVVQPWFWATLAFLGGALDIGKPGVSVLNIILFVLAAFISVLVHELGHALTGKAFGAYPSIVLQAFGGYATFGGKHFSRGQDLLVTAAGPAIQIVLGAIFYGISRFFPPPTPALHSFVWALIIVSIVWAIINLLPVLPLDGGRLMAALLGPSRQILTHKISIGVALAAALGLLVASNFSSFLFPIFLLMMAHQNWQALQYYRR